MCVCVWVASTDGRKPLTEIEFHRAQSIKRRQIETVNGEKRAEEQRKKKVGAKTERATAES